MKNICRDSKISRDFPGFILYHFHRSEGFELAVTPFLDTTPRGLFATRAPRRPNNIGISVVKLAGVTKTGLDIEDVDIIDGTPLLDIKPYVPEFDCYPGEKAGWFPKNSGINDIRADRRFADPR